MLEFSNINLKNIYEYLNKYQNYAILAIIIWWLFIGPLIRRLFKRYSSLRIMRVGFITLLGLAVNIYSPSIFGITMTIFFLIGFFLLASPQKNEYKVEMRNDENISIMDTIAPQKEKPETPLSYLIIFTIVFGIFLLWIGIFSLQNYKLFFNKLVAGDIIKNLELSSIVLFLIVVNVLYVLLRYFVGAIRLIIANYKELKELDDR